MNTNKKYKDSVFTRYFSDEQKLRLLYNALEGTNYGEEYLMISGNRGKW